MIEFRTFFIGIAALIGMAPLPAQADVDSFQTPSHNIECTVGMDFNTPSDIQCTGERIRDKIAASKRKGIWMGGVVPLGYRIENRALHVVEEHAVFVRDLYRRYLEIGSVVRLKAILDLDDARSPLRTDGTGKAIGGGLISRGHLYKILSNPIYLGRLTHKGQVHDGLHDPIVDQETWHRVQRLFTERAQRTAGNCQNSDALLAGKLFDDRGNRMSPSHAAKGGRRWRYYVSQAILQGRKHEAGSVARAPALEIEARVAEAVRAASPASNQQGRRELHQPRASGRGASTNSPAAPSTDYDATLRAAIERVVVSRTTIEIELAEGMASDDQNRILIIPWTPPSPHRRREIIQGEGDRPSATRPMRTEARAVLTDALRDAHRWLDELTTSPNLNIESLAAREGKTERWIRRTISLAFLCPDLAKAAIDGRLPRGFGVKRLMDLPMAWPDQWSALGAKGARRTLIAIRTFRDLADQSSRAVGNPKFGVGDSFPRSPAKARRPSRIDPADHWLPR